MRGLPSVHLLNYGGLLRKELEASAVELLLFADRELLAGVVGAEGRLDADGG